MDKIHQVYKKDAAAQPSTTPERHICTLPQLPSLKDKHEGPGKSINVIIITATVRVTTMDILICI